jgi:hypothetical protein
VGIVKQSAAANLVLRATKNPPKPRNKPSYAPDAESREHRGKIAIRKDYFASEFVSPCDCENLKLVLERSVDFQGGSMQSISSSCE